MTEKIIWKPRGQGASTLIAEQGGDAKDRLRSKLIERARNPPPKNPEPQLDEPAAEWEDGDLVFRNGDMETVDLSISKDENFLVVACCHEGAYFGEFKFPMDEVRKFFLRTCGLCLQPVERATYSKHLASHGYRSLPPLTRRDDQ